jgi:hypothetical protein
VHVHGPTWYDKLINHSSVLALNNKLINKNYLSVLSS